MKKRLSVLISIVLCMALTACSGTAGQSAAPEKAENTPGPAEVVPDTAGNEKYADATLIVLDGSAAAVDGKAVEEFDYSWHTSPDAAEEWYEGEAPETDACAYIAHDLWYYPELDEDSFTLENYDGEDEWVCRYTAEGLTDYIYSTLPHLGDTLPVEMMHSAEEAYNNPVLHIVKPGTYVLRGEWNGQIFVDLGDKDETFADENAAVTLILDGVEVTCGAAPAFIAYSAYECDNGWEDRDTYTNNVDTSGAGVHIVLADGSINSFTGCNVFRLLKPEYKKNSDSVQKKSHKIDGAFYSFVSMEIGGEEKGSGILNVRSTTFEGLDDELHLTINGGYIHIYSQDDGINVNEDGVSVFTMNGGTLHIFAGLGAEGDVIDSNGYIVVNGGLIAGGTPSVADDILDSDCGSTVNGGEVINIGSEGMGMGPGGGMPMPGGRMPGQFEGEMPEWPNGEMPEMPEGAFPQRPEDGGMMGVPPEKPEQEMPGRQ